MLEKFVFYIAGVLVGMWIKGDWIKRKMQEEEEME